jgi:peptide/nickel transport system substrate-binding protein
MTVSRRAALRSAVLAGGALAAISLAGCGGSSSGGGGGGDKEPSGQKQQLDPTQGKRGGKLVIQAYGDPGAGLELWKIRNPGVHQMAGFTHDGLLEHRNGTPAFDGGDIFPQPNLAQAMPEQSPDQLTYIYKLRPAKFHNGRQLTSEDVKYTYERNARSDSAWRLDYTWLDTVTTPDANTVVIKTKTPFSDALMAMTHRYTGEIWAKEWEESPEHEKKLMGTGPYLFVSYEPPVISKYKRNPEYHRQPYPYFEEIDFLGTSDPEKKIADFTSKQVHMTYWFPPEERDRVKKARPDAQVFGYRTGLGSVYFRTDVKPFNDKRVRQAFQMTLDRKAMAAALTAGEGEPDQALSIAGTYWGFRKPSELGAAAKYWNLDIAEAKKLLAAAGVSTPIEGLSMPHWNATVVGQKHADTAVLTQAQWKQSGIANIKDQEMTFGQSAGTYLIGNYDTMYFGPNTLTYEPIMGQTMKDKYWSPPEGIKAAPTLNPGWVNDRDLSALVEKQNTQFKKEERLQTLKQIEDNLAENQYHISLTTNRITYMGDPSVKNMQVAQHSYNGAIAGVKYWWFDK